MIYLKAPNQDPRDYWPRCQWGRFTRYLEIGDDQYAVRHVDLYGNGYALRYDRSHWVDEYGMLADMRHSNRWVEWWGPDETIEPSEFEEVWQAAASSPTWTEQLGSTKMATMGRVPVWLLRPNGPA